MHVVMITLHHSRVIPVSWRSCNSTCRFSAATHADPLGYKAGGSLTTCLGGAYISGLRRLYAPVIAGDEVSCWLAGSVHTLLLRSLTLELQPSCTLSCRVLSPGGLHLIAWLKGPRVPSQLCMPGVLVGLCRWVMVAHTGQDVAAGL